MARGRCAGRSSGRGRGGATGQSGGGGQDGDESGGVNGDGDQTFRLPTLIRSCSRSSSRGSANCGRGRAVKKPPLTATERYKKYYARKKENEEFKESQKSRKRRQRESWDESKREEEKELLRERMRLLRKRRREESLEIVKAKTEPYSAAASFGKARARVRRSLPSDEYRAKAVLEAELSTITSRIGHSEDVVVIPDKVSRGLSSDVKKKVTEFYKRSDISYHCPGMRDYVMVRLPGQKRQKLQKYILLLTMKEAYVEFLKLNPSVEISLSCFSGLRPPNVLCRHKFPQNVCKCIYHL